MPVSSGSFDYGDKSVTFAQETAKVPDGSCRAFYFWYR
jgi:hypothetical protein